MARFVTENYLKEYDSYFNDPDIVKRCCYEKNKFENFKLDDLMTFIHKDFKSKKFPFDLKLEDVFREIHLIDSPLFKKKLQDIYFRLVHIGKSLSIHFQFATMENLLSKETIPWGKQCSDQFIKFEKIIDLVQKKAFEILEIIRPKISQHLSNHYSGIAIELNPISYSSLGYSTFSESELEICRFKIVCELVKIFKEQQFSQVYQNGALIEVYWTKDHEKNHLIKKEYIHLKIQEDDLIVSF